ncbi:hypothetical protein M2277_005143 [Paenibacillus sp. LBL]|nr:hypothetical protein [Paenibacillus sp. LBL]
MVFTREELHSAMDALDRLGKMYTIDKITKNIETEKDEEDSFRLYPSKEKHPHLFDRWIIREV